MVIYKKGCQRELTVNASKGDLLLSTESTKQENTNTKNTISPLPPEGEREGEELMIKLRAMQCILVLNIIE